MSSLYRFLSVKPHVIESIFEQYLYFNNISDFNDPFEDIFIARATLPNPKDISDGTLIRLHQKMRKHYPEAKVFSNEEFTEMLLKNISLTPYKSQLLKLIYFSIEKQYELFITNKKHCCFIQDDDEHGVKALKNKLMWSHYADGLRGFSIEFDKAKLLQHLSICEENNVDSGNMYYGNLAEISLLECFEESLDQFLSKQSPKENLSRVLSAKSVEWKYEYEYRISSLKQKVNFDISCVKSITIGSKMPAENKESLIEALRSIGFNDSERINEAVINQATFDIDIVRCTTF